MIGHEDVGGPREMRAHHRDQRRWLRKVVDHLEADTNFHAKGLNSSWLNLKTARRHHASAKRTFFGRHPHRVDHCDPF